MPKGIQDINEVAAALLDARNDVGLKQTELARALETGQPKLSAIENAVRPPRLDLLIAWLNACGGRLDVLTPAEVRRESETADPLTQRLAASVHALSDQERLLLDVQLDLAEARIRMSKER